MATNFEVNIDGLKLSKAQQAKIAETVRNTTFAELAKLDLGKGKPLDFRFHPIINGGKILIERAKIS